MPKVSSPARRPHVFIWSSPPWSARGRRTEPISAQAQRERRKEGAPWRATDQVIAALPQLPRFAPPGSRQLTGSRSDGDYRWTQGRSLSPARPIPAEEGSDQRAANTARPLGRGGGRLWATSARGGCGSMLELPTMVWRRGRSWGP